jgi:hypothetical protein
MLPSWILPRVALVRTDISDGRIASIIRVTKSGEQGTLVVNSNRSTLRTNLQEDGILHSNRRENLKSYIALTN